MSDPQKSRVYTLDGIFWNGSLDGITQYNALMPRQDWEEYAEYLFHDGLAQPYQHQLRRTRRTAQLRIDTASIPQTAIAYLTEDRLSVSDDRLQQWVAMHEVAHLLVPHSCRHPHYWRWASVYIQMVTRHTEPSVSRQFSITADLLQIARASPNSAVAMDNILAPAA